jgi:hypothetical protein
MKPFFRTLVPLALVASGIGAASAQQTLTFTNTDTDPNTAGNQSQSVTLLAGSSVSIAPDGNVSAQCALTGGLCTGTGSGGGSAPTVSLAASNFSQAPTGGLYPPGTTFTLTPTVANAEVCIRSVSQTTPGSTNWPATVTPPFAAQTIQLLTGEGTYQFSMRCFGPGGATTATLTPDISTSTGTAPGGCSGFTSNLPAGWVRGALTNFASVPAVEIGGATWQPFPNSGFSGYLITGASQYQSVTFTTPTDPTAWNAAAPAKRFQWIPAQQGGEAIMLNVYVSISSCAGDFRIPPTGQTAPTDDTTYARGCRSIRPLGTVTNYPHANISYQISAENLPSDDNICRLAPGRTYFVNFIRAQVFDGYPEPIGAPSVEATCEGGGTTCGIQMRVE